MTTKYIFITGGVVSSLGKGIAPNNHHDAHAQSHADIHALP
jgi:CTP synthase (UTP-ammonia lyase)